MDADLLILCSRDHSDPLHVSVLRFDAYVGPDSIDAIQSAGSTGFRAVEELDGVAVEGEALELLDKALREDVVEVEDVEGDVHHRADENQAGKEGNDTHHSPILSLNTDLRRRL